jgi:hypothetical protein
MTKSVEPSSQIAEITKKLFQINTVSTDTKTNRVL